MSRFCYLVFSQAVPGCEAEYEEWYDNTHLPDILRLPGALSGRRFRIVGRGAELAPAPYLAIYEFEASSPDEIAQAIADAKAAGNLPVSDALDRSSLASWFAEAL